MKGRPRSRQDGPTIVPIDQALALRPLATEADAPLLGAERASRCFASGVCSTRPFRTSETLLPPRMASGPIDSDIFSRSALSPKACNAAIRSGDTAAALLVKL